MDISKIIAKTDSYTNATLFSVLSNNDARRVRETLKVMCFLFHRGVRAEAARRLYFLIKSNEKSLLFNSFLTQ